MAYRYGDRSLEQKYEKQIFSDFYCDFLRILRVIEESAYLRKYSTLQQGTHKIGFSDTPTLHIYAFSYNVIKISNCRDKNPNIFALYFFIYLCFLCIV